MYHTVLVNACVHTQVYMVQFLIELIRVNNQISGQQCVLISSVMTEGMPLTLASEAFLHYMFMECFFLILYLCVYMQLFAAKMQCIVHVQCIYIHSTCTCTCTL